MTEPQETKHEATEAPKVKTIVRRAKIEDLPELIDMCVESALIQVKHGNQLFSDDPNVLRGGFVIEAGMLFHSPRARIVVAQREENLIGYLIGTLEDCGPTEKFFRCVKIRGEYLRPAMNSLQRPLVLLTMWETLRKWGIQMGADYFFSFIHPGNTPSIRVAKRGGFKHNMTQFVNIVDKGGT